MSGDYKIRAATILLFLDVTPQSCGIDPVSTASILLEVWAPGHLQLQLACGSFSGLCLPKQCRLMLYSLNHRRAYVGKIIL